jgi:hypothetical protein
LLVLFRLRKDPFFAFSSLQKYHMLYFIHTGKYGTYDKNCGFSKKAYLEFIENLNVSNIGIHPSYASHLNQEVIREEINKLAHLSKKAVTRSRQHFIKLKIPYTYEILNQLGIKEDYSMGWPDKPGYRAGTTRSFYFYHLGKEEKTDLKLFPFCWMDAHFIYHHLNNGQDMIGLNQKFIAQHQKYGGTYTPIFHNNHFYKIPELYTILDQVCNTK